MGLLCTHQIPLKIRVLARDLVAPPRYAFAKALKEKIFLDLTETTLLNREYASKLLQEGAWKITDMFLAGDFNHS